MVAAALPAHAWSIEPAARSIAPCAARPGRQRSNTVGCRDLMETFDGDRSRAVDRAESLEKLPLPAAARRCSRRVVALRAALTGAGASLRAPFADGRRRALEAASNE